MPELPTRAGLGEVFVQELITRSEARPVGERLTPEQARTPGSDINLLAGGTSVMAEEVVRYIARAVSDGTLDGATGARLVRWVADRYSPYVTKKEAAPSRVQLQFTRTSIAAGAKTQASGSVLKTAGGIRFKILADAAFGATSLGPVTVNARAVDAGIAGNVDANTITAFVTAKADPTLLVTNPQRAAGGDFTESDESFRERARAFWAAARRGVLPAIEFGALTVPGVRQALAEEQLSSPLNVPNGFVFLFIADANGQSNDLLDDEVEAALLEYRAGGIIVDVFGATPTFQAITYLLSYRTGTDTAAAFDAVRATTVANVNQLAPGATLERSLLFSVARSVNGVIVGDDAVVLPAGDVVPTAGQIIRTRTDLVTSS
jgi:phage-related baseplate assembly protein